MSGASSHIMKIIYKKENKKLVGDNTDHRQMTKYPNSFRVRGQVSAWVENRCSLTVDKKEIQDLN